MQKKYFLPINSVRALLSFLDILSERYGELDKQFWVDKFKDQRDFASSFYLPKAQKVNNKNHFTHPSVELGYASCDYFKARESSYQQVSWEEFFLLMDRPTHVIVPLNNVYSAIYDTSSKDDIKVGCQTFKVEALRALLNEIEKLTPVS